MKYLITLLLLLFSNASSFAESSAEFYKQIETCRNNPKKWPALAYAVDRGWYEATKFLMDEGASADQATPPTVIWYEDVFSDNSYPLDYPEPGYTPIEIAIQNQDCEMIRLLVSHKNAAKVEYKKISYADLYQENRTYSSWGKKKEETPLGMALATGNESVILEIVCAHKESLWLFNHYKGIAKTFNATIMSTWMKQQYFLWKSVAIEPDPSEVQLFLTQDLLEAVKDGNLSNVQQFLNWGWFVSSEELEAADDLEDPSILQTLLDHGRSIKPQST